MLDLTNQLGQAQLLLIVAPSQTSLRLFSLCLFGVCGVCVCVRACMCGERERERETERKREREMYVCMNIQNIYEYMCA